MLPDRVRLQHMLEMTQLAIQFTRGVDRATFDQDIGLQLQVTRALEIVGEAAANVSAPLKAAHPEVPWSSIVRMRNRLVHAYFHINLTIVWKTIAEDLPPLIPQLQQLLHELPDED